jgi:hypothetical protein
VSQFFSEPTYQQGLPSSIRSALGGKRGVPDVAADADPATGMDVYTMSGGSGSWETVGGTSLAAPLIAGMWAVAGGAPGAPHPVQRLYDNERLRASSLYDVTTGSNGFCGASDVLLGKTACSLTLWALANTGDPNNLSFSRGGWTGNLDCGWRLDGQLGTLSDDRQCRAGVGYDGPSGLGTPRNVQLFQATPPTAKLAAITGAPAGSPVSVQGAGQVTASGDALKQCAVSWGDGQTDQVSCATGAATHAYAAAGSYTVTFSVTDTYGLGASATQPVTITDAS